MQVGAAVCRSPKHANLADHCARNGPDALLQQLRTKGGQHILVYCMLYAFAMATLAIVALLPMHVQSDDDDEPNKPTRMTVRLRLAAPLLTAR